MEQKVMHNQRTSNIELLRLFAIVCVIILHTNLHVWNSSGFSNSNTHLVSLLFEAISIGAVNIFFIISGYFLCKSENRFIKKPICLLLQVILLNLCLIILPDILHSRPIDDPKKIIRIFLPNNYFVTFYVVIYVVSPYINKVLKNLSKNSFLKMLFFSVAVFSFWPCLIDYLTPFLELGQSGYDTISRYGSDQGYNILNFINMYLVGAYIQKYGIPNRYKNKGLFFLLICIVVMFGQLVISKKIGVLESQIILAYNNPMVIFLAISTFCLFTTFSFNSKLINGLSKATFTCYLIHNALLSKLGFDRFVNSTPPQYIFQILWGTVVILIVSWMVFIIYDKITTPVINRIFNKEFDYKFDDKQ